MAWRKSRGSHQNGDCVEIAQVLGLIAVRDSENPADPMLTFEQKAFRRITSEIRRG